MSHRETTPNFKDCPGPTIPVGLSGFIASVYELVARRHVRFNVIIRQQARQSWTQTRYHYLLSRKNMLEKWTHDHFWWSLPSLYNHPKDNLINDSVRSQIRWRLVLTTCNYVYIKDSSVTHAVCYKVESVLQAVVHSDRQTRHIVPPHKMRRHVKQTAAIDQSLPSLTKTISTSARLIVRRLRLALLQT